VDSDPSGFDTEPEPEPEPEPKVNKTYISMLTIIFFIACSPPQPPYPPRLRLRAVWPPHDGPSQLLPLRLAPRLPADSTIESLFFLIDYNFFLFIYDLNKKIEKIITLLLLKKIKSEMKKSQ